MRKLLCTLLFVPSLAVAQQTIIKAARLFDGTSDTLIQNATIVVEGKRIALVSPNAVIPPNARVIDLGDATLLPGFIDAHVHLTEQAGDNWYLDHFNEL